MHLVYFDDEFAPQLVKNIEPEFPNGALPTDVAAYHDMAAFHLGSLESIGDLNTRLPKPISIHNFRPNIIVSGVDAPYGEVRDHRSMAIGCRLFLGLLARDSNR